MSRFESLEFLQEQVLSRLLNIPANEKPPTAYTNLFRSITCMKRKVDLEGTQEQSNFQHPQVFYSLVPRPFPLPLFDACIMQIQWGKAKKIIWSCVMM